MAVTRAVRNLYLIEPRPTQPLLTLLGLTDVRQAVDDVEEQRSSLEEWRREAHRLELQGKDEQAAEIRGQILKQQPIPWTVLRGDALTALREQALEKGDKKARIALMEYALVYRDQRLLNALNQAGLQAARHPDKAWPTLEKKHYLLYTLKNPGGVLREADKYGVDFRNCFGQTPLMIASRMGNADLIEQLLERDADVNLTDGNGLNAFQIALDRACADERFARSRLPAVFERLAPPSHRHPGRWPPGQARPAADGIPDAQRRPGPLLPAARGELGGPPQTPDRGRLRRACSTTSRSPWSRRGARSDPMSHPSCPRTRPAGTDPTTASCSCA